MTTVVYKDGVMCGDGQVTRYGSLIESVSCVKVRNIGGVLVGGAGGGVSIMKFFDWFADKVESEWALAEYPNLNILPPEDLVEEDFQALVVSPDGSIFEYIGTKNIFPVTDEYASIGSGCLYAYPLLDAGFSAKEAVEGAIKRCPFSGGQITEVTFDEEGIPLDREMLEGKSKEEIIKLLFPDTEEGVEVDLQISETVSESMSPVNNLLQEVEETHRNLTPFIDIPPDTLDKALSDKGSEEYATCLSLYKSWADSLELKYSPHVTLETLKNGVEDYLDQLEQK